MRAPNSSSELFSVGGKVGARSKSTLQPATDSIDSGAVPGVFVSQLVVFAASFEIAQSGTSLVLGSFNERVDYQERLHPGFLGDATGSHRGCQRSS